MRKEERGCLVMGVREFETIAIGEDIDVIVKDFRGEKSPQGRWAKVVIRAPKSLFIRVIDEEDADLR